MAETIQYGHCTNKSRCSLAYNRETVFVPLDGHCPECGQPLQISMAALRLKLLPLLFVVAALGAGGYYGKKYFLDPAPSGPISREVTPAPDASPGPGGGSIAGTNTGGRTPPAPTPLPTPTPKAGVVDDPDFEDSSANIKARKDVLTRIKQMPRLTDEQRAKLIGAVGRARNMGCIFIIPFESGQRTVGQRESEILANGFKSSVMQQLLNDPTVVFVVLGYADKQGDAQMNEKVSMERAQSVLGVMKDRCGVVNVTYGVGMGGSNLFDAKTAAKNRLVEIWAAFP